MNSPAPETTPPEAPSPPACPPASSHRRRRWRRPTSTASAWWARWNRNGGNALLVSLGIHAVFFLAAAVWVVHSIHESRKLTFTGRPSGKSSPNASEVRVQAARRARSSPPSLSTERITSNAASAKISLPELPALPPPVEAFPSRMPAMSSPSLSASTKLTAASSLPGSSAPSSTLSPLVQVFGFRAGGTQGLTGTFYDLKQSPTKNPMDPSKAVEDLKQFAKSWDPTLLNKYYRARLELTTQRIYIPETPAEEAPRAFGADSEVKASLWIVHYRGKVIAPKTGTFRFRGNTSDWLTVRFDRKNVFDGGTSQTFALDPAVNQDKSAYFSLAANKAYEIEILIGNYPGGVVYASLFLQEKGQSYAMNSEGQDLLPLFQIGKLPPPTFGPETKKVPPFAAEPVVFRLTR